MKLIIIANIRSGGNKGKAVLEALQQACIARKFSYEVYISEYIGHIRSIIKEAASTIDNTHEQRIVIIGGDGTLNDAVTGLKHANLDLPVAYLPAGTGNDFAREFNITYHATEFLNRLEKSFPTKLEVIEYTNNETNEQKYGINSIGFGFDALVAYLTNNAPSKGILNKFGAGKLSYLSQIVKSYANHQSFAATITAADGQVYQFDDILLCSFMNHSYFGGGIRLDPLSSSNNHEIGMVVGHHITKPLLLKLLPQVLFTGKHFENNEHVVRIPSTKFHVQLSNTYYMQTDGEASVPETLDCTITLTTALFWKTF